MIKKIFSLTAFIIAFTLISSTTFAAEPFYQGKVIRIIVGLSAGGGYDLWARLIARHIGKYIPGHPVVIVENMTGAGSIISANHVYKVAKPDGLTIGHPSGIIFLTQLYGSPGIDFDARKFEYIGAPYQDEMAVFLTKKSGITSMEKWINSKAPVKFGGEGIGSGFSDSTPKILAAALGLPTKTIVGYKGTSEVRLAVDTGELDGICLSWVSGKLTYGKAMQTGDVIPILQVVEKPIPEIPNVPLAISYAKTEEARQLIDVGLQQPPVFARPFTLPPGTPKERVQILRDAFTATMKDKEVIAEAQKARMEINPVDGERLAKTVKGIFSLDPAIVAKLKEIVLKP